MTSPDHSWLVLTSSDQSRPILTSSDQSWPVLIVLYQSCPVLIIPDHSWPFLTIPDHSWPFLTSPDLFWPVLTRFDLFWKVLSNHCARAQAMRPLNPMICMCLESVQQMQLIHSCLKKIGEPFWKNTFFYQGFQPFGFGVSVRSFFSQ